MGAGANFHDRQMEDHINYNDIEFHEKLGEGGGGTVHRVTFKKPFKGYTEAAVKSVWEVPTAEVDVMKKLKHPNIVPLLGFYQHGPVNILLLEYAPKRSLHDYLKDHSKPVSQQLTGKWLGEAADALEFLHDRNILHRDIKAPNCLLFDDNVLKLSDFGIAREIDRSQTTSEQKGTFRYMAPEIHRGNEQGRGIYSKASDIYAYGMLALEIVTRKPPFEGIEWQTVVFSVCEGKRPSIPSHCPLLVAHLIQSCWCDDPKRRPTIRNIKQTVNVVQNEMDNLKFHENLGNSTSVTRVTLKDPAENDTEAAAKIVKYLPKEELDVLCKLQHPNIVSVLDIIPCVYGFINVIVVEFAPNGSLNDYLNDDSKHVPQELVENWLWEAAGALSYLHGKNILHKNIKPSNCLLFQENVLKLSDYGLHPEGDKREIHYYMAPETISPKQVGYTKPSDIYAYGMLTLEIVKRSTPLTGTTQHDALVPVHLQIPKECPQYLSQVIKDCCKVPRSRPTAEEIKQALKPEITITEHHGEPNLKIITLNGSHIASMTCSPDGNMVILDMCNGCLCMFNETGEHGRNLPLPQTCRVPNVIHIAVSPQGNTVVLNATRGDRYDVHVFNLEGKKLRRLSIAAGDHESLYFCQCITTDRQGKLLVVPQIGQNQIRIYDIHLEPKLEKTIALMCEKKIKRMTVNSRNQILCTYRPSRKSSSREVDKVQAVDFSGKKIFKFKPTASGSRTHSIEGILCDSQDNIYVVICTVNPNGVVSHIHQYSSTGTFIRCVHMETGYACDLSIAPDGTLVLAKNSNPGLHI